jgi:hypothetical protein
MDNEQKSWRLKRIADKTDADYLAYIKSRCVVTASGCWEWQGFRMPAPQLPYGTTTYRQKIWRVHRLMYLLAKGQFALELDVLHECDNAPCCNPDHLRLGTHDENVKDCARKGRIFWAQKTHCPRGHAYDEHNTRYTPGRVNPKRQCIECYRVRAYKRYHGKDAIAPPRVLAFKRKRKRSLVSQTSAHHEKG